MFPSGRPPFGARRFAPVHVAPLHSYVPMPGGHTYLCAVMDWHSRKVRGWAASSTMETGLCLEAQENALTATGRVPEIFNTDQGCQFASAEWTGRLLDLGVKISMDGPQLAECLEPLRHRVRRPHAHQPLTPTIGKISYTKLLTPSDWRPRETLENLTPAVFYQNALTGPHKASGVAPATPSLIPDP